MAVTTKPKVARAVHANRGVEARYRKQLLALIDEMGASVDYWLTAAFRKDPPRIAELIAEDATPSSQAQKQFREVAERWLKRFDDIGPRIARDYVEAMFSATDRSFAASLKDAGWSVRFKMTSAMRDAFDATLSENIALIKSIPARYLDQVQGSMSRGYAAGRDLAAMVKDIRQIYPKAQRRVVLITRDQSNKLNGTVIQVRRLELGITEAIWLHSHGGKEPRKSHLAAHGRRFKIAKGCYIDGEYIQPGEKIGCRCVSKSILPI